MERLLAGMIAAVNDGGYGAANVSAVIALAGVSRPTFYEYFRDRDECFLAAVEDVHQRLQAEIQTAVRGRPAAAAATTVVEGLVRFAGSYPADAQFLMNGTLAGGPRTLDARDRSVLALTAIIRSAYRDVPTGTPLPDLRTEILIGATYRLLASRLRRGERAFDGLLEELLGWMSHYERDAEEHRWRTRSKARLPATRRLLGSPLTPPEPLPPGRPSIGEEAVAENHRLRIMFATAELVQQQGYTATTIGQIATHAGVDARVFYRVFADKEQAFSAIHELGFQQLMASTAGAFFTVADWPGRMWEALRTLTGWLESNSAIAHVGFVESYAVGPGAVQRVEDSLIAFTIFLQEGYQQLAQENPPTRVGLEVIVTNVFEILYREIRADSDPEIAATVSQLVYLSLAPFMGPEQAGAFIDTQLTRAASASSAAAQRSRKRSTRDLEADELGDGDEMPAARVRKLVS